jgi:hypothetical protein
MKNVPDKKPGGFDAAHSPVSQTGAAAEGSGRSRRNWDADENPERLALLLKRSLSADSDWSPRDLADMLMQEINYRPAVKAEAMAYFRQSQARAKRAISGDEEGVHPELALGLYYVALTRAWMEDGVWISKLSPLDVAEGLRHVQKFAWVKDRADLLERLSELALAAAK